MKPKLKLGTLTHFSAKQADILMMNKNPEKKKKEQTQLHIKQFHCTIIYLKASYNIIACQYSQMGIVPNDQK